jgi:WhiB family redox-sensing transcriptional regulator
MSFEIRPPEVIGEESRLAHRLEPSYPLGVIATRRSDEEEFDPSNDWMAEGLCATRPKLFFPPFQKETKLARDMREAAAKEICAECPVRRRCLDEALSDPGLQGVLGGTTDTERKKIRNGKLKKP